jgi:hypothetical protein
MDGRNCLPGHSRLIRDSARGFNVRNRRIVPVPRTINSLFDGVVGVNQQKRTSVCILALASYRILAGRGSVLQNLKLRTPTGRKLSQ